MAQELRTYRHAESGAVGEYSPRFAARFPVLEEVPPGTKPLAYTPIPQSAVDEYMASHGDEDAHDEDKEDA